MNGIGSDDNDDGEFECSECDFKCLCEIAMVEHSAIHVHQSPNNDINCVLNIIPNGSTIENDSNETASGVNLQGKFNIKKEIELDTGLTKTTENNLRTYKCTMKKESSSYEDISKDEIDHHGYIANKNIKLEEDIDIKHENDEVMPYFLPHQVNEYDKSIEKRESSSYEDISTDDICHERYIGNKINKLENIDIKHENDEIIPYFSPHQVNEYDTSHQDQSSQGLMLSKTGHIAGREAVHSAYNNVNIFTQDGIFSDKNIVNIQQLDNEITATSVLPNNYEYFMCTVCAIKIKKRKDVQVHLQSHSSEQISNTVVGVKYVGKVGSKGVTKGKRIVTRILHCCEVCNFACSKYFEIFNHLKDHSLDEIEAADRDKYGGRIKPKIPLCKFGQIEIEVDNTGVYIPDGWQRKVCQYTKGVMEGRCSVKYISPCGRALYSKIQVSEYIKCLEFNGITAPITVEQMDFSCSSFNLPKISKRKKGKLTKIEIEVDNTGKYIPDGWQRKGYQYTMGFRKDHSDVKYMYISPFGKTFWNKRQLSNYIKELESNGIMEPLAVEKMDFTCTSSHNLPKQSKEAKRYKREIEDVDNTGKYIPNGWQRKLYRYYIGPTRGQYVVKYISPLGKSLWSKPQLLDYIKRLESNGITEPLNVEKMDFTYSSHIVPKKSRRNNGKSWFKEITVDNTGKYIPEGWERKVYQYKKGVSKGSYVVKYISPFGRTFSNRTQVSEYIEKLESNVIMEPLTVEKMDFTWASHGLKYVMPDY